MPDSSQTTSPALLALIAAAIAFGAAASLLASKAPVFQPTSQQTVGPSLPAYAWGLLFLSPLLVGTGAIILRRVREFHARLPRQVLTFGAVILVLAITFIVFAHATAGSTGSLGTSSPPPPPGGSSNNSNPGPPSDGGPRLLDPTSWGLPPWLPLVVVAIAALIVVAFVVPSLANRIGRGGVPAEVTDDRAAAQAALSEAATRLDGASDPRSVIIDLYRRLLGRVTPLAGDLDPSTPEEIRDEHLLPMGVRADAADQLTRLFEEARYSSHPMGVDATHRALEAIRAAEADLGRVERSRAAS